MGELVWAEVCEEVEGGTGVDFHDLLYKLALGEDFGVFPAFDGLADWFWFLGCFGVLELIESELHGFVLGAGSGGL